MLSKQLTVQFETSRDVLQIVHPVRSDAPWSCRVNG
jgi:hypothetical protein